MERHTLFSMLGTLVLLGFVATFAGVATWLERKVMGRIQHRYGPTYCGPGGFLIWLADGIKLILKEDLIPDAADNILFRLAPYVVFVGSFAAFAAIPFAGGLVAANLNIGIFYIIAVSSSVVIGILMAGWSSGNKWALFGAMRAAAQIVSYEIPIGITLITVVMMVGSLNLQDIVAYQGGALGAHGGGCWNWLIFKYPPFTIIMAFVYFIAAISEINRTPFDIPEADSELVAGYHTEYSGIRFSVFFMAEYANSFAVSAIATTLFLGGWLPPYGHFLFAKSEFLATFEGLAWFLLKSGFLVFVLLWLRWTLPRYRVDQLMRLCWKVLLPIALVNLGAVGGWICWQMSQAAS
ncbi:MAG: NADH-quinone oxidoreductase subunit NuoH [Planctomycetes bacterium]|nr:NADH-quinone oxidoreductase subunit NuoH [Planctomycetota bacterium]